TITSAIIFARCIRLTTRASTVSPPRSVSTLPGRRVLPMRAWMMAEILKSRRVILAHFLHRTDDVAYVIVCHPVEHRKADQTLVSRFGNGKLSAFVAEAIAVVRMKVNRNVVDVDANVLGSQRAENFGPGAGELPKLKPDRVEMPRRHNLGRNCRNNDSRNFAQCGRESRGHLVSACQGR